MRPGTTRRRLRRWPAPGLVGLALLLGLAASEPTGSAPPASHDEAESEDEEDEGHPGAVAWFYGQRAFPHGVPPGAYQRARDRARRLPASRGRARSSATATDSESAAGSLPVWYPIGPQPLLGNNPGFSRYTGPPPWSGRVTALAPDPAHADTVYLGAAEGGVWKTSDGGGTWTPIFDGQDSLAIGSLAVDPSNPSTVYAGTGEANDADRAVDSLPYVYYGTGLFKSTDAGASWTKLAEPRFGDCHIGAVTVAPDDSNAVLAAVSANTGLPGRTPCTPGVYRSADAGASWTLVLDTVVAGTELPAQDLAVVAAAPATVFAALKFGGVYRSTDGGLTWSRQSAGLPPSGLGRVEVAVSPADPSRLFAAVATTTGALQGIYTSADGGDSWTPVGAPDFCLGQCYYNLVVGAHPADPTVFFAGGVTLRKFTHTGAASATVLNPNTTGGASGIHWDLHALAFDAAGRLWIGTDGGVYRSDDGGATAVNLNATLSLSQFHGISGAADGPLLGGMQDNASAVYLGNVGWTQKGGGDGSGTGIDPSTAPATMYVTSYGMSVRRSTDGGKTFTTGWNKGIATSDPQEFIWPFATGGGSPRRLYAGTNRVYRSTDRAANWAPISPQFPDLHGPGTVTAIAEAPSNSSVIYAGTHDGQIRVTTTGPGANWVDTNGPGSPVPTRYVTDIAVDPADAARAYVSVSGFDGAGAVGHVFATTDTGGTWTDVSGAGAGALPDTPVNALVFDPATAPARLFAGTDVGVFVSTDGGTSWARLGTGLPNVVVLDLLLDPGTDRLVAATHGRGLFAVSVADPPDSRPDLDALAVTDPPAAGLRGQPFPVTDTVRNIGGSDGGASSLRYYLSTDAVRDAGDTPLSGGRVLPTLAVGAADTGTVTVTVPDTAKKGTYFLLACADDGGLLVEADEANNCVPSVNTMVLKVADLKETAVGNPPSSRSAGARFTATETTKNAGTGAAGASTTRFYLSANTTKGTGDILLNGLRAVPTLAAGASSSGSTSVTIPAGAKAAKYFLLACADDLATVSESSETNNCRASGTTITVT